MRKKILGLVIAMIAITSMMCVSFAGYEDIMYLDTIPTDTSTIKVMQDGQYIDFTDSEGNVVEPQIINDRTMVPFRKIFNSLGVVDENIEWIGETSTVKASKDNVEIELQIGNNVAVKSISGETEEIKLDSAPVIVEGRTLVPVRFIAESMNKLVGWDADYRTVIIIDTEKLLNKLEEAIPNYMEVVKLQTTPLNAFTSEMVLEGEIEYKNKEEKSENSTLKFVANIDLDKAEDSIAIEIKVKFSGNGAMYNELKEMGITNIDIAIIAAGNKLYLASSLLGEEYEGKWLAIEDESISQIILMLNDAYANPVKAIESTFNISEDELNIFTYAGFELSIQLLEDLLGNDNVSVTGTKTKKYEIKVDMEDLLTAFGKFGVDSSDLEILKDISVVSKGSISNGVAKTSSAEIKFEVEEENENIKVEIDVTSEIKSYNKTVKINIPSDKELITQ